MLAANLVQVGPQTLFQQVQSGCKRGAPTGSADKGCHLLTGLNHLTVVVQVGVGNHPADIVGEVALQNPDKRLRGEKFHRLVQQGALLIAVRTDHLLEQAGAGQNPQVVGADLGEEGFKGQAGDVLLAQLRQDVCDVAAKEVVGRDDDDVVGIQPLGNPLIHQECHPMQGNRGLAAAGNALHKDQIVEGVADNHVWRWMVSTIDFIFWEALWDSASRSILSMTLTSESKK